MSELRKLARSLRLSPLYPTFVEYVRRTRDAEREAYEASPANEFARGRVSALNDLLEHIKD